MPVGVAPISAALDGLGPTGGTARAAEREGVRRADTRGWHLVGVTLLATGPAMLGRSALALLFSAAIGGALIALHAVTAERSG